MQQTVRYSITSSASARIEFGNVIPIAFAVLRLRIISNFVAGSTGRSAGFAPLRPINGTQGDSYSATLTASGGSGTGYSFSIVAGGLPNGLSLASNGAISGTINSGPGLYGFGVQVADSENNTGNLRMSLDVVGPGPNMYINTTWLNDPVLGDHYGAVVSVCCGGTAPFTWTASNLPPGLTFEPNTNSFTNYPSNPGGLQIYGIPEQTGTYDATFTVTDANLISTSVIIPMHVSILDVAIGNTGNGYNLPNGTLDAAYSPTAFRVLGGPALATKSPRPATAISLTA